MAEGVTDSPIPEMVAALDGLQTQVKNIWKALDLIDARLDRLSNAYLRESTQRLGGQAA